MPRAFLGFPPAPVYSGDSSQTVTDFNQGSLFFEQSFLFGQTARVLVLRSQTTNYDPLYEGSPPWPRRPMTTPGRFFVSSPAGPFRALPKLTL